MLNHPLQPLAIPGKATLGVEWQRQPATDVAGAVIAAVPKKSLAERAGLAAGQIVVAINDQPVSRRLDILRFLRTSHIGETVSVQVRTNDDATLTTVTVPLIGKGGTGFGL